MAAVQAALSKRDEEMPMSSRRYTAEPAVVTPPMSRGDENGLASGAQNNSRSSTPGTGGSSIPSQVGVA